MATFTTTTAPQNTSFATFKTWAKPISDFFATCGWVQQNDTGQVVWTATVLTCTAVATGGGLATYTFSSYTGPDPRIGMSFTFSTFGVGGNNVTATVTAKTGGTGGGSGTVSVTLTTQATDTTGSGTTTAASVVQGQQGYYYEIWKTGDSVGFDVYVRASYGTGAFSATIPGLAFQMGTGSNGAGVLINPNTAMFFSNGYGPSATAYACHLSGDSGRMMVLMWHGQGQVTNTAVWGMERSYDNTGTPTGAYYSMSFGYTNVSVMHQVIFSSGALTTNETGGLPCVMPKTATTGNVGSTTLVSPVFPLVGGLGNPLTNIMVYRATDFADNQVVYVTVYGVQHLYITVMYNVGNYSQQAVASSVMMRFD